MNGHKPHKFDNFPVYMAPYDLYIHYTCNAPPEKVLKKHGIACLGESFGCSNKREVLKIPKRLYKRKGFPKTSNKSSLSANLESLLNKLK